MKFLILLLAIKGLMPSKKTRKKLAKRWKRIHRARKAVSAVKGSTNPAAAAAKKVTGVFKKIRFVLRCITLVCITVPAVILGVKGYRLIKPMLTDDEDE